MADENLELEEKQVKEYDDKLFDCLFTCEGGGAAVAKSSNLATKKAGIHLHFSRFALFPNSCKDQSSDNKVISSHQGQESETIEEIFPAGAPPVEGFFYAKTYLCSGFMYIMDEGNPNLWYEYEVDYLGNLSPVYWAENKDSNGNYLDIRKSSGKVISNKTFKQGTVLWIAFSPVQWSIDYHTIMRTNTERRAERMVKVVCSGFERNAASEVEYITPFDSTFGIFPVEQKHQAFWLNNTMKEIIADDNVTVAKDPQALKEDMFVCLHDPLGCLRDIHSKLAEKNLELNALVDAIQTGETVEDAIQRHRKDNIYSTFYDPEYHALFTLANTVYKMVYSAKENIEKYDGGAPGWNAFDTHYPKKYKKQQEQDKIKEALRKKNAKTNRTRNSGTGYADLGRIMRDNMDSSRNRIVLDAIGAGIDREKIEGILGVHEREILRNKIQYLRNSFGNFLKSDYCQAILDDFSHNCDDYKASGHSVLFSMISDLFSSPFDIERTLLLNQNYPKEDKWKSWAYNELKKSEKAAKENSSNNLSTTSSNNKAETNELETEKGIKSKTPGYENYSPLSALLGSNYNENKIIANKFGLANKICALVKLDFKLREARIIKTKLSNGRVVKSLNEMRSFALDEIKARYFTVKSGELLVDNNKLHLQLGALGAELDKTAINMPKYRGSRNRSKIDITSKNIKIHEVNGETIIDLPINRKIKLSDTEILLNKINNKAARILNSRSFNSMLVAFQAVNVYEAMSGIKPYNTDNGKSILNVSGIGIELSEAAINTRIAMITSKGIRPNTFISSSSKLLGSIGGGVTSAMCFWDAYDSFKAKDVDAGVAWAGAGVAYGVSTAYGTILSSAAFAGPIGLLAAGFAFGLLILAYSLSDEDLEKYFKHFLLSDEVAFPKKQGDNPIEYGRSILSQKEDLMDNDLEEKEKNVLMNPLNALIRLYDLTVCTNMSFTPDSTDPTNKRTETFHNDVFAFNVDIYYAFNVELSFMSFLDIESLLDGKIYLFPKGIKNGKEKEIIWKKGYEISTNPKQSNKLNLHFNIPRSERKNVNRSSYVMIALRIKKSEYSLIEYPLEMDGQIRYLGACFDLGTPSKKDNTQVKKIKIESLETLKKADTWD